MSVGASALSSAALQTILAVTPPVSSLGKPSQVVRSMNCTDPASVCSAVLSVDPELPELVGVETDELDDDVMMTAWDIALPAALFFPFFSAYTSYRCGVRETPDSESV